MGELRGLPSVDRLKRAPEMQGFPTWVRARAARDAVRAAREAGHPDPEAVLADAVRRGGEVQASQPRGVINLSGVVLHTGLGRARLASAVRDRLAQVAGGHAAVEYDLADGRRGDRQTLVAGLLRELTGAEAVLVVNNCAAAAYLTLTALAEGRDVLLSRGEMVEIGGSFRMPDIVARSGGRLVEVGTTNKTRLADYEGALSPATGAVLRCHPSNFVVHGFTEAPTPAELTALSRRARVPLVDDVGSGCLVDTTRYGLPKERTLREALRDGADVVTASGDKLLGGPQAGLILGRAKVVARIARHPLARVVRVDKLTLTALEATLRLYLEGREGEIPVWRYLGRPLDAVRADADRLAAAWPGATVAPGTTEVGGGSLPGTGVPTWRVGLPAPSAKGLLARLRAADPPVVGYVSGGRVWLDPRTAEPDEVAAAARILEGTVGA